MKCNHCGEDVVKNKAITEEVNFHEVIIFRYYHYHCAYQRWWTRMGFTLPKSEYRRVEKTVEHV